MERGSVRRPTHRYSVLHPRCGQHARSNRCRRTPGSISCLSRRQKDYPYRTKVYARCPTDSRRGMACRASIVSVRSNARPRHTRNHSSQRVISSSPSVSFLSSRNRISVPVESARHAALAFSMLTHNPAASGRGSATRLSGLLPISLLPRHPGLNRRSLQFAVELCSKQQHQSRNVKPHQQNDHRAQRSIGHRV